MHTLKNTSSGVPEIEHDRLVYGFLGQPEGCPVELDHFEVPGGLARAAASNQENRANQGNSDSEVTKDEPH